MQLRDNKKNITHPNKWVFPGGHLRKKETKVNAAKREFFEETNYKCKKVEYLMEINLSMLDKNKLKIFYFLSKYKKGQKIICKEGQDLKFFSIRQALKLRTPKYLSGVLFMLKSLVDHKL